MWLHVGAVPVVVVVVVVKGRGNPEVYFEIDFETSRNVLVMVTCLYSDNTWQVLECVHSNK